MSLAPEWMRRSRVFVRTPDGRVADGVDITDQLGGGGGGDLAALQARVTVLEGLVSGLQTGKSDVNHNHNAAYAPVAHTSANHPHGPVTVAEPEQHGRAKS